MVAAALCGSAVFAQPPVRKAAPLPVRTKAPAPVEILRRPQSLCPSLPPPPAIRGQSAVLLDAATGQILATLNPEQRMFPASLTKMMTTILAAEHCRPEELVTVTPEAAAVGETSLGLRAGQQVPVQELLTGAILKSANDAAAALACHVGGTQAQFAEMMNAKAQELGLRGTHFVNPHGLHSLSQYTTAGDLAVIARCFWSHPLLREIAALPGAQLPTLTAEQSRQVGNQNRLLRRWDLCTGLKTGYTKQAGNCYAASARSGGWDLICVVLNSRDIWTDARSLLEWGYGNYTRVKPALGAGATCPVSVRGGQTASVLAGPAADAAFVTPRGAPRNWQLQLAPATQRAPVAAGQPVGWLLVRRAGQPEVRLPLLARQSVAVAATPLGPLGPNHGLLGLLALSGAVLLYGTANKTFGPRRRRLATRQRTATLGGARVCGWGSSDRSRAAGGRRAERRAARRASGTRTDSVPVRYVEQTPRPPDHPVG